MGVQQGRSGRGTGRGRGLRLGMGGGSRPAAGLLRPEIAVGAGITKLR